MQNIQAVIFDMDGVLIDSEPFWRKTEIAIFARYGIVLTDDDCNTTMGMRVNEVVKYWFEKTGVASSKDNAVREIIDEMERNICLHAEAMPGVFTALELLQSKNLPLAVASSSPLQLINATLQKLQIAKYFDAICSAEFEKNGKPAPDVFLSAAKKLKTSPAHCLVIEDSYHGMMAALNAGMKVCVVPDANFFNDAKWNKANYKLKTLAEVTSCF